jgi:hypothetical protein
MEGKLFFFDYREGEHFIYMNFKPNIVGKIVKQKKGQTGK